MDGCLPSAHFSELESLLQQKNYRQRGVSKQLFIIFRHRWTITKLLISRKFGWSFWYRILQRHQWDLDIFSCYTFFLEKPQGKFILQLHVFASTVNLFCNYMSLPALLIYSAITCLCQRLMASGYRFFKISQWMAVYVLAILSALWRSPQTRFFFLSLWWPQEFQAMLNTKPRCTLIIGHAIDKIFNQCTW